MKRMITVHELYKSLIDNQYEAALCMLNDCIEKCPDELWHEPVAELKYCQVVFHTLFFTDVYLGTSLDSLRKQPFHQENVADFGDYKELEKRKQRATYEKSFIRSYFNHCRKKAADVVSGETAESLAQPAGFDWLDFSRAEVHVYNIRHLHHHAAQLSLHLRLQTGEGIPWCRSGWHEVER